MGNRITTFLLLTGLGFVGLLLAARLAATRLPGDHQGYEPAQPISYSHRLHAGELKIDCLYCHSGAEKSRHAGIPAASTCMNCHRYVSAPLGAVRAEEELAQREKREPRRVVSPEIQKIYDALALNPQLQPDPARAPRPLQWIAVHKLPDFVYFDHRAHVGAGVQCQQCHGPVQTMERVRQVADLSMGWCVNCHRTAGSSGVSLRKTAASTDCSTCHY